jgi:hypothetical protein
MVQRVLEFAGSHMDAESSSGVESVAEIPIFEMTNLNACI